MKHRNFPNNFLWGSSISGYQTEGFNLHSDWYNWENSGKTKHKCGTSTEHYLNYKKDINYLDDLNQNAFRLSVEWSRIEPKNMHLNGQELDHYRQVLFLLKKKKIKVFLTLNHFVNPQWFIDLGGWANKNAVSYYVRFVQLMVDEFKEYVDFWITFNEPMIYAQNAYLEGNFPPGKKNYWEFRKVLKNMIKAHKISYRIIHRYVPNSQVGIAKNNQYFEPYSSFFLDKLVVWKTDLFWNHYLLGKIKKYQDFIGLNYYFHNRLKFQLLGNWFAPSHFCSKIINKNEWVSDNGFEIFPSGIHNVLLGLKKYKVPIYITENGIADAKDVNRKKFILSHLRNIYIAIKDFCDVRGYLHWSLLDNYECGSFDPRFGLIEVDYSTKERKLRDSARYYSKICENNSIEF